MKILLYLAMRAVGISAELHEVRNRRYHEAVLQNVPEGKIAGWVVTSIKDQASALQARWIHLTDKAKVVLQLSGATMAGCIALERAWGWFALVPLFPALVAILVGSSFFAVSVRHEAVVNVLVEDEDVALSDYARSLATVNAENEGSTNFHVDVFRTSLRYLTLAIVLFFVVGVTRTVTSP